MAEFLGFDHIDTRVRSLGAVEAFYDRLMPELGLSEKRLSFVDAAGDWQSVASGGSYNTVEYFEKPRAGHTAHFIGFIEDRAMQPTLTRIAFRVASAAQLSGWIDKLTQLGAAKIEPAASMEDYPAVFFEDPAGTKLEIVARKPGDV